MAAVTLNNLENRLERLEAQVLPPDPSAQSRTIVDILLEARMLTDSALRCRECIAKILDHAIILNTYLDPSWEEGADDVGTKQFYLIHGYPTIRSMVETVGELKALMSSVESANISSLVESGGLLEQLFGRNVDGYEENRRVTLDVYKAIQRYNDIMFSVKLLFAELDREISTLEERVDALSEE